MILILLTGFLCLFAGFTVGSVYTSQAMRSIRLAWEGQSRDIMDKSEKLLLQRATSAQLPDLKGDIREDLIKALHAAVSRVEWTLDIQRRIAQQAGYETMNIRFNTDGAQKTIETNVLFLAEIRALIARLTPE